MYIRVTNYTGVTMVTQGYLIKAQGRKCSDRLIFRKSRVENIISILFTFQCSNRLLKNFIYAYINSTSINIYGMIYLDVT